MLRKGVVLGDGAVVFGVSTWEPLSAAPSPTPLIDTPCRCVMNYLVFSFRTSQAASLKAFFVVAKGQHGKIQKIII